MPQADVIIVGSGLAALMTAYHLHEHKNVMVFTKTKTEESNSWLAQGGVAATVAKADDWRLHYEDTLSAGAFHNDEQAVELLVREGPERLLALVKEGLRFDVDETGQFQLGNEGAHRRRRILHAGGDQTGKAIVSFLLEKLNGKVTVIENESVTDLLVRDGRCLGIKTRKSVYYANAVVLSTGGCGNAYAFTSNAPTVTGDGIALAYRVGAVVSDMEFIQFHPTMLYVDGKAVGLISEAVRGEGAILVTEGGKRLMEDVHPQRDLAPRDIVARAIHAEMMRGGRVYLDISMIPHFQTRFPTIAAMCKANGVDIHDGKLPVVPGAHFLMGGIQTDLAGNTSLKGLYAVGEVACTGVHGANRLASNSLLEGIVFGARVAETLRNEQTNRLECSGYEGVPFTKPLPSVSDIQTIMTKYVGIVRNENSLTMAKQWFEQFSLHELIASDWSLFSEEQQTAASLLLTGWLITTSALKRTESRGGHYRSDFPKEDDGWKKRRIERTKEELFAQIGGKG